ncbi:amino acid permease [Pseudomonas sp. SMV7]|uniref:amino acid permease n=1 Tax=Pseudomonas sp. SMV7 TaxID=3390194 RepID=UPI003F861C54
MPNESKPSALKVALKTRHVSMLALGSALGAGLFVGSSTVIASTGPGAFITYALTGVIVALVMRMLGEMAAAHPVTGSFIEYARLAFGRPAGYMTGWLYWYFWVIVVGFEAVAGAQIINGWLPDIPVWTIALGLMMSMTLLNLMSVHSFGEAEYWFAGVKVVAILVFVGVVVFFMLDNDSTATANFGNLTAHGGFLPYGVGSLFAGVVVVIFSMTGMEVATLAAAESGDPARSIRKVANTVIMRIMIFYVLAIFLIVVAQPWSNIIPGKSPFVTTLEHIGIPAAGTILTAVILVAVLSVLNAGIYTASRVLFILASNDDAPRSMARLNHKGVPVRGVIASTLVGYGCVVIAALWPDTVFQFLINSSGTVFLFVYLMICLSQLRLRSNWVSQGSLKFAVWGHPWVPLLVIAAIVAVLASMAFDPVLRISLGQCGIAIIALAVYYLARAANNRLSVVAVEPSYSNKSNSRQ